MHTNIYILYTYINACGIHALERICVLMTVIVCVVCVVYIYIYILYIYTYLTYIHVAFIHRNTCQCVNECVLCVHIKSSQNMWVCEQVSVCDKVCVCVCVCVCACVSVCGMRVCVCARVLCVPPSSRLPLSLFVFGHIRQPALEKITGSPGGGGFGTKVVFQLSPAIVLSCLFTRRTALGGSLFL